MEHILTSESCTHNPIHYLGFYKIIRKAKRKLSGKEQLHENNDLTESEHANGTNGKKNA
jgi:hypothetical protein